MDNGLVLCNEVKYGTSDFEVLILIIVDNGLVPKIRQNMPELSCCINPCCSGQWPRTRPYKTLLIINKLKNITKETFTSLN